MIKLKKNKKKIVVSGAIACVFALLIAAVIGIINVAAEETSLPQQSPATVRINSIEGLINYANEYKRGGHNPNDVLQLALSSGSRWELPSDFVGLGAGERPFNGTIEIANNAISAFSTDKPLFDSMTTNVKIINASSEARELAFMRQSNADTPLLANKVRKSSEQSESNWDIKNWIVKIVQNDTDESNPTAYSFAGVVSVIENECKVSIEFTHDSKSEAGVARIESASNVGAICGTLGDSAELTVKCMCTDPYTVTSTGGHAGGIVGQMGDSSKIILAESFSSQADVTASASDKYAGGVAGYATNADIVFTGSATAALSKTVTGTKGAGGVFGYYKSTGNSAHEFDLAKISSDNLNVKNGYVGGFIGYLEAENSITINDSTIDTAEKLINNTFTKKVNFTDGTNCGGIIGAYSNTNSDNTLYFNNVKVNATSSAGSNRGGLLGSIIGNKEAYVKVSNVYTNVSSLNAGVIASMGDKGSFVDMENTVKVKGGCGNGLISVQNDGLVRIKGLTDLSEANYSGAQLIGTREHGIVYALGSGADANWTFKRSSGVTGGTVKVDDIGDWGEVLRLSGSGAGGNGLTESTFFTVNDTTHKVTVASHTESIGTVSDFIKTALNIQSNNGSIGYLVYNSSSESDTVLGKNLTLTANIDLSDTGIESFTRDNGTNGYYTGTFNGGNHTITLAIGEAYGQTSAGGAVSSDVNRAYGMIIKHTYQGLFAKINNATFNNLTVDGFDHTTATSGGNIGGIAAVAKGNVTLSSVVTKQENRVWAGTTGFNCGGAIGKIEDGSTGTISVSGCTFGSIMNDFRQSSNEGAHFGGCIGYVDTTGANTFNFNNVQVGLSGATASDNNRLYQKNNTNGGRIYFGGLIGVFKEASSTAGSNARQVNLTNITVNDGVEIQSKNMSSGTRGNSSGAFIGCVWPAVDVTIGTEGSNNGITIGNGGSSAPKIEVMSGSNSGNIGALFYQATGKMDVHHVKVNGADISSGCGTSTFGFIVNDAIYTSNNPNSALYLNVDLAKYDITATSVTGSFSTAFDEIAAYSVFNGKQTDDNGQAIISLNVPNNAAVIMDGANCNTYQNQTSYATKINQNTRYYYNLEAIRTATLSNSDSAKKLLMWSVSRYAHSTVKNLFTNGFGNTISGNCDMEGLSYYPVDASGMIINAGTTIKFYNEQIETAENLSGGDNVARSTHIENRSQHYLMHEAIFRNYTGTLTVNGLTVQGNVSNDTGKSGFIVRNTLGNTDNLDKVTIKNIVLDGAVVNGTGYAPLLINDIGKNVSLDMSTVSTKSGSYDTLISGGGYAASSLIGDVGSDTATNITLKFSDMVLDPRTTALLSNTSLTGAYGTGRTIFSRATFLNNFAYANGGYAEYNYEHDEDYGSKTHHVTYAKEVSESVEYAGRENQYFNDDTYFTDPTTNSNTTGEYDFSSGFLPHVYNYNGQQITDNGQPAYNYFHEIRVNLKSAAMESGCGQYNDPYIIKNGDVLSTVANIISDNLSDNVEIEIILPSDLGKEGNVMWHDAASETDRLYRYTTVNNEKKFYALNYDSGTNTYSVDTTKSYTLNDVREYLAGAYYSIEDDIELPADFVGLGALKAGTSDAGYENNKYYAFRGVIIGHNHTLINMSNQNNPLIRSANGCVVKDLTVSVGKSGSTVTIQIGQDSNKVFRYDNEGCMAYGAVIGRVMGGDNIIDHVGVDFTNATFTNAANTYVRLVPVGGFVGVVVNGGVIFRNMNTLDSAKRTGLTIGSGKKITFANDAWLYVNPIIGRVISGYAFNEASSYAASSVWLDNGTKNYGICDLNPNSSNKLTVNADAADNHTVTIPDAQAFYVLSCIVNSGAGSAAYSASTEQAYATINDTPWIAYRKYTQTRCAQYSSVATDLTSSASSYTDYNSFVKLYDKYNTTDATGNDAYVPYIIRNYTTSTGPLFRARSICGNSGNSGNNKSVVSVINLSSDVTYDLPIGYRGIGSIYSDNTALALHFNKLDGKNATVNLSMYYCEYDYAGNGSTTRNNENYNEIADPGFGLFNIMHQICNSDSDVIKDLTFTGSVVHEAIKSSNPKTLVNGKLLDKTTNVGVGSNRVINVGGLAGYTSKAFNLNNVKLNGLSVSSIKYGGGLIGYAYNNTFTIENCGTGSEGVSVEAKVKAGGMIGYVSGSNAQLSISQTDNEISFTIDKVKMTYMFAAKADYYKSNQNYFDIYTAGGLIGTVECGNTANVTKLNIQNVIIRGKSGAEHVTTTAVPDANHLNHRDVGGGVIGSCLCTDYNISGVRVIGVSVHGGVAGGIIGFDGFGSSTTGPDHTIDNSVVDGNSTAKISSIRTAGGLIGKATRLDKDIVTSTNNNSNKAKIVLSNNTVKNITICSEARNTASKDQWQDDCAAGTAMGSLYNLTGFANGGCCIANIYNYIAENCTVYTLFKVVNPSNKPLDIKYYKSSGTGGIMGAISHGDNAYKSNLYGHNILLNNVTIKNYDGEYNENKLKANSKSTGFVCGNNYAEGPIKIVGLSLQNMNNAQISYISGKSNAEANTNYFGSDGYVVMADYDGTAIDSGTANTSVSKYFRAATGSDTTTKYAVSGDYAYSGPFYEEGSGAGAITVNGTSYIQNATGTYVIVESGALSVGSTRYVECDSTESGAIQKIVYGSGTASLFDTINAPRDCTAASPFVTVNPSGYIGTTGLFLTSDGIASKTADLPINRIYTVSGTGNNITYTVDSRYSVATSNASTSNASVFNNYKAKLSTYNTEQGTKHPYDFAVLVVDDVSKLNVTNMINSYINLLANTNYIHSGSDQQGYEKNRNGIYNVNIYKMVYNTVTRKFEKSNEEANLKKDTTNNLFYMNINSVDTAGDMFTLIDVAYLDPADTSKIAYHLYIPVLVKKLLTYDFEIATGSGTNYERNWYNGYVIADVDGDYVERSANDGDIDSTVKEVVVNGVLKYYRPYNAATDAGKDRYSISSTNRWSKPLMENLGTPVTLYFKYTYLRTNDDWQNAINNSENLIRNFDKKIVLSKTDNIDDLPDDTLLVLVDVSNGGKPYYARFSQVFNSTRELSLSGFREVLDDNTSSAFKPKDFCDMLQITAETDANGTFIECNENDATTRALVDDEYKYLRLATDDDPDGDRYKVTVGDNGLPLEEQYYISFFTTVPGDDSKPVVYHYTVNTTSSFNDSTNPSRINNNGNAHLILGKIFDQTAYTIKTREADIKPMSSAGTHAVTTDMSVRIMLDAGLKSEIQAYLGAGSGINVYHSFVTVLERTDEDDYGNRTKQKIIAGDPTATGSYKIESYNGDVAATSETDYIIPEGNGNYVEIKSASGQNLNEYLMNGDGAVVTATVKLDYGSEESIAAQFPNRSGTDATIGTKVTGSSNISFNYAETAYSNSKKEGEDTGRYDANNPNDRAYHSYFCKFNDKTAKLYFNVKHPQYDDYGPLGINPLDTNGLTEISISTLAIYDVSSIKDKVGNINDSSTTYYNKIKCTLKLYRKSPSGQSDVEYDESLDFPLYMKADGIEVEGYAVNDPVGYSEDKTDSKTYVFILPRSVVEARSTAENMAEYNFAIPINFCVKTGSNGISEGDQSLWGFEELGLKYSNYKITLDIELIKDDGNTVEELEASKAHNFIIYTNARILPGFIEPVSQDND